MSAQPLAQTLEISIHVLREEDDFFYSSLILASTSFLSTPSARRATQALCGRVAFLQISIHALREEGDSTAGSCPARWSDFYPRPPRGGRRAHSGSSGCSRCHFYPRPPRGGRQQKQRENTLLLSHYTPPCTNCKEVSVKQAVKLHRYLHSRPLFQCEASRKTMCTVCSHWPDICR